MVRTSRAPPPGRSPGTTSRSRSTTASSSSTSRRRSATTSGSRWREDAMKLTLPFRTDEPSAPGVHPKPLWSWSPRSDREAGDAVVSNFALHWFPAKVFKPSLDWNYSLWLGTASAALLLLLTLSGLPLLLLYIPSVERAYGSVKDIEYVVTFGKWIRAVHRISAHLMVAVVFLHLVRVFLTGSYQNGVGRGQKREWNWVIGVGMLLVTLFLSFTGYLLPWDQLAFWA